MWRLPLVLVVVLSLVAPVPGASGTAPEVLAVVRGGDVWTIRADGGGARRLIGDAYSPSWSPDGSRLAFVSGRSGDEEVYMARADGSKVRRLTSLAGPDLSPSWSPDGGRLAWSRGGEIWTMSATGSAKRRIVRKTQIWHENHSPTWGGDRIVFSSNRVSTFNPELYSVRAADGSGLRRLTRTKGSDGVLGDDGMADFAPDGRLIVFTSNRDRNGEIYVMRQDGSGQKRLTRTPGDDFNPRFSGDGRRIAFTALPGSVFVVNVDGTGLRRLGAGADPDWRPGG